MAFKIGDAGKSVGDFTDFLNRKFPSYSRIRRDEKYGLDEARVVAEAMRRYGLAPTFMTIKLNGVDTLVEGAIATDELLARAGWRPPGKPMGRLITVQGSGQPDPWGPGLPADTARAVEDLYDWWPVGDYPATPFPEWPSIQLGIAATLRQVDARMGAISLAGYSQGAVVVGQVLKHHIMNPAGSHNHRLQDVRKVVLWGNPMRQQGIAHFDEWDWPVAGPDTHGILEDRLEGLEHAPFEVRDYAHDADMYASVKDDDMSEYQVAIARIVMRVDDFWEGDNSLRAQITELLMNPIFEGISMFEAISDAIQFATSNAHGYNIGPAIAFLRS